MAERARSRSPRRQTSIDTWTSKVLDHVSDAAACERIRDFLSTEEAKRIIAEWVVAAEKPALAITDMSDVYKVSMMGAFGKVQRRFDQESGEGTFRVRFSLNVRKSSELPLEEIFARAAGSDTQASEWQRIRDQWLRETFAVKTRSFDMQVLREMKEALPPPLKTVVQLDDQTLQAAQAFTKDSVSLRAFIKQSGRPMAEWSEIVATGTAFVVRDPSGAEKTLQDAFAGLTGFEIVCNAEGPWHLVTFFETSVMQVTAQAIGQGMQLLRGWSDEQFYAIALELLDGRFAFLDKELAGTPFDVFLFAGRRSTHAGFHLLQNLWCTLRCCNYKGTSSLFAYRVFRNWGWITADGKPAGSHNIRAMPMVGTHAHEASMVFQAIAETADDEFEYPISSVLWHMNYWLLTGNQAVLPDTCGSPAFSNLIGSLKFPPNFVEEWSSKWAPKQLDGGLTILENLQNPLIGGLIRQDSGCVASFIECYFTPPIVLKEGGWVHGLTGTPTKGYKCLASEIGSDSDVTEARKLGYLGMGTGGYLGEKPWSKTGELSGRIDLVAKVSQVERLKEKSFFPVKLGDYERKGEWHVGKPGKFAVSPAVQGNPAVEEKIFQRYKRQGEVPKEGSALFNLSNFAADARKAKRFDTDATWRQERFDSFWETYRFV